MKTFKTVLAENALAAMPHKLLHAKTASILGDHGYEKSDNMINDVGGVSRTYSHKFDPSRHDDESDEYQDYHTGGPETPELHSQIKELGWTSSPMHSHYVETPNSRVSTETYTHPNGSVLHKVTVDHANDDPHHSWTISHPREND